MKVELGNFGYSRPDVVGPAEKSVVGRALGDVGVSISQAEAAAQRNREAFQRAHAANEFARYQLAIEDTGRQLEDDLRTGAVAWDRADDEFQSRARKLPAPQARLDNPIDQENQRAATGEAIERGRLGLQRSIFEARTRTGATQFEEFLDTQAKRAAEPGADIAGIAASALQFGATAREFGIPEDQVQQRLGRFRSEVWGRQADRRLTDARNSIQGLDRLIHDLGDARGHYADKLDPDARLGLLRAAAMRQDALRDEAARAAKEAARDAALDAKRVALENVLLQGGRLDPASKDQRDFVDALFVSRAQDLGLDDSSGHPLDPTALAQRTANLATLGIQVARRTGIVPTVLESQIRTGVRSPSGIAAAQAVDSYGQLKATSPELVAQVDADTRAFAETAVSMMEAGTAPLKAVEVARGITWDAKPEVLEQRKRAVPALLKEQGSALNSLIDRDYDKGWFNRQPEATQRLAADFDAQTERYFLKTGDTDLARKLAWEDLNRVYGETEINGAKVLAPFPVERFGLTPAQVRAQIAELLKAHPAADGSTADDILVVPDAVTLRSVNDALDGKPVSPSYALITKTDEVLTDREGRRLRFAVPTGEEIHARLEAERAAEAAQSIEGARRRREIRREAEQAMDERARIRGFK